MSDHSPAVFGTPALDSKFYHQQRGDFTCALVAQAAILHEYTGVNYEECKAAVEAAQYHLIDTGGTSPEMVGAWLDLHGVPCHRNDHAGIGDILQELDAGHKVIVGVNGERLWGSDHPLNQFANQSVDHAIWLTGVDLTDANHPKVIINDSGDPNGAGKVYNLDDFLSAAETPDSSGFFYVSTDHPPPNVSETTHGFDVEQGCVPALQHYLHDHALQLMIGGGLVAAAVLPPLASPSIPAAVGSEVPASPESRFASMNSEQRSQLLNKL